MLPQMVHKVPLFLGVATAYYAFFCATSVNFFAVKFSQKAMEGGATRTCAEKHPALTTRDVPSFGMQYVCIFCADAKRHFCCR